MAHSLAVDDTARHEIDPGLFDTPKVRQACVDLAACFRMAARLGMEEGICNHFSAVVPGFDDCFIVNPFGLAFDEIRASDLIICDFDGRVLKGDRPPEITAYFIHARVHRSLPRARVAFHTHMPYATSLALVEGQPLQWAGQTALKFYGRTAVDDFNGLALDAREGDRIAAAIGDADVVFMRNHGVMVVGKTIAEAWNDLYYLERACEVQVLAESTGRKLSPVPPELAAATYAQMRSGGSESAVQHLASIKRRLLKTDPDYLL
ncbi:aldolase [Variovorax sp.]|jgi:ribulose-5-phosphate 4-epimerase/fuculose-1-phosphate aldolase|uniref:aldolase n=1 Tax=Variovorax sp. TaxID=1871043 RepID=UPI001218B0F6|nr:aldolase [Variovorax sp.]TAJ60285.1 MAG: aldolase [Variovorax sp.]